MERDFTKGIKEEEKTDFDMYMYICIYVYMYMYIYCSFSSSRVNSSSVYMTQDVIVTISLQS